MSSKRTRTRSRKAKLLKAPGSFVSPYEIPCTVGSVVESALIPEFRSQIPYRKSFRFCLTTGVGLTTGWTTTMMLDLYAISIGGSSTPVRIYNNMKLIGLKAWQPSSLELSNTAFLGIEFSPSTTAGFGGAPRVPYTASGQSVAGKYAHLCVKPKKTELASQWFSAQQANYVLFNMVASLNTVIQIDFMVTEVNGETPVTNAYTSSIAKGTVGVTNFGVAGCRSIGLENLVNP